MNIEILNPSREFSNTYVIGDKGKPCILIDPGFPKASFFESYINEHHDGKCLGILLTHGHFDHISGLKDSNLLKSAPIFIGKEDQNCFDDKELNASIHFKGHVIEFEVNSYPLEDEDEIKLGEYIIKVIHTPFHTSGSCCFFFENDKILFSGDTLFNRGIGRSDLKGACPRKTESSLTKLANLPLGTRVYPGHGRPTTIETEYNYGYLRGLNSR